MSENIENITPDVTATPEEQGLTPGGEQPTTEVPAGLQGVSQEQMKMLREKLARFAPKSAETTASGSEAPTEAQPAEGTGSVTTGKDVDWSEYDLEYEVRHLYKDAQFRETKQGPKWIALVDEFMSTEKSFGNQGQTTKKGEKMNLAEWLNDVLNTPEGWRVVSILPAGMSRAGVLLQRQTPIVLPDPKQIKKVEEVAAPREEELQRVQDAAQSFLEAEVTPEATPEVTA